MYRKLFLFSRGVVIAVFDKLVDYYGPIPGTSVLVTPEDKDRTLQRKWRGKKKESIYVTRGINHDGGILMPFEQ